MTAKEMFEALGYECSITPAGLYYVKGTNAIVFLFEAKDCEPYVAIGNMEDEEEQTMGLINVKEHKAITQQMKELKWI